MKYNKRLIMNFRHKIMIFTIIIFIVPFINSKIISFDKFKFYNISGDYYNFNKLGESTKKGEIIFYYNGNKTICNYSYPFTKYFNVKFPEKEYCFLRSLINKDLWSISLNGTKIGEMKSQFLKLEYFNFNITIYDIDYSVKSDAISGYLYIQRADKEFKFYATCNDLAEPTVISRTLKFNEAVTVFLGLLPIISS